MTAFTSGTQARDDRTVNRDPEPYVLTFNTGIRLSVEDEYWTTRATSWAPREEYAVLDNRILAAFRAQIEDLDLGQAAVEFASTWAKKLAGGDPDPAWHHNAGPAQVKHACKVLGRYARIHRKQPAAAA